MASRKFRKLKIHFFTSVCLSVYSFMAHCRETNTQCYIVCVCVTHPSVIKLRGGSGLDREGRGEREMAATTTTTTADQ